MQSHEWRREGYCITTDPRRVEVDVVHGFLSQESSWARGIPRETVQRSVENAVCFTLLENGRQIGFARVISDRATVAYVGDVFVLPQYRGRGLSKWLMECVMSHPELQHLRRWILLTGDAHGLYRKFGFRSLLKPERYMEIHDPDVYTRN